MKVHRTTLRALVIALVAASAACAGSAATQPTSTTGVTSMSRPTEPFRKEHVEIKEHLEHLEGALAKLTTAPPDEQRRVMQHVVGFMREHIKPHAEWEERVLYPAVDKRAATGPNPFTASMRYEHRIVGRWTDELAAMASAQTPDAAAFLRRAENLLGLISAHFEEEEEVLLPILDRTMTKEDFAREVGSHDR